MKIWLAAFMGAGLCAAPAWSFQEAGGVVMELSSDAGEAEGSTSKDAETMAMEFLREKGWTEGSNDGGRFYVIMASAGFAAPAGSEGWDIARSNAFNLALLTAKRGMADYLSQQVAAFMGSAYSESTAAQTFTDPASAAPSDNAASGVAVATAEAVNADLKSKGVDPAKNPEAAAQAAKRIVADAAFVSAVQAMARAEVAGLQAYRTFEGKGGPHGSVTVICVFSDKGMQLRDALIGLGDPPTKAPGPRIGDWAEEMGPEALLFSFGTQARTNEDGELVLVGFGQANPAAANARSVDAAKRKAQLAAVGAMRQYLGELVTTSSDMMQAESLQEYSDKSQDYANESAFNDRIASEAKSLDMPGILPAYQWKSRHPLLENDTVGVVLVMSVSEALKANKLRERLAATAASQGGRGIGAKTPANSAGSGAAKEKPKPRAPATGAGAAGEDP